MSRLLIVSNRLPVTIERRKDTLQYRQSVGGLVTGLSSFYNLYDSLWIGWCGIPADNLNTYGRNTIKKRLLDEFNSLPVFLSRKEIRLYYHGFSNKTIWPLFHYFTHHAIYDQDFWTSYRQVNKLFCNEIVKIVKPGDTIWIHDYHLMLLSKYIREKLPDITMGFFLHIPFPSFEIFRLLPWRKEVLSGLLGADLIGFHTYDYVRHFLSSVRRILGYEYTLNVLAVGSRRVSVDAFPIGIPYENFANAPSDIDVKKEIKKIRNKVGDSKIILSVDRVDYTKGILERLEAFDLFLDRYPEYREKVTMIMVAVPSRTAVETYIQLKRGIDELVGRINGKHGTLGWQPVWYLYRYLPFKNLTALYSIADVALVTPLRDGMNLIAKEFIATKNDGRGVLILSEMTGAARELAEAIIVNPNNREEVARALMEALTMSEDEQIYRNTIMQKRLKRYNILQWARDYMDKLSKTTEHKQKLYGRKLTDEMLTEIIEDYNNSSNRLLLLDYDGTLVPFKEKPQEAKPDKEILRILKGLSEDPSNEVVIVSGRDRNTLDKWFGDLNLGLSAEHGVWIKEDDRWELAGPLRSDWKNEVKPLLESYVDRTPGSFLEEKEYSLVWHYRKTVPELASVRVGELRDDLAHFVENLNMGVLEGNKVVEIKNTDINKGRAASHWISKRDWDFILSIGDDVTDEDIYAVLPEGAYSIKLGFGPSRARYSIGSVMNVRSLLEKLVR